MKGRTDEYRPGKWRVRVYWKGKRYSFHRYPDGTPLVAEALAIRLQERINSEIDTHSFDPNRYIKQKPFGFLRACDIWIESSSCGDDWKKNRKWNAEKWLKPYWGSYDLRDIHSIDIQEFLLFLKNQKLKDKTIYNILNELKNMLRFHSDAFEKIPRFPRLSYQLPEIKWLEFDEQEKVFQYLPREDIPIFTFLRWTGCRPSEACGLLRENVNLSSGTVTISTTITRSRILKTTTKTKQIRMLPVIEQIREALKPKHLGKFVFMRRYQKELIPYSVKILERVWNEANQSALKDGIRKINLYNAFRHSFACQRLNSGSSIENIREILGHTCIETTERYAKYKLEKLAECMRAEIIRLVPNGLQAKKDGI